MVVLNKIYTRTGDKGTTALGTGQRLAKYHLRIASYGTVDEASSAIGMARIHLEPSDAKVDDMLARIQSDLFDLGADLCTPDTGEPLEFEPLRISDRQVQRLESEIDLLNGELEPLRTFILPGGKAGAVALHVARTVCRRAERLMVELSETEGEIVNEAALRYINRLSDLLFVASRYVNNLGEADILWSPGENH
jgi:cob(I)alamin adenosyltransferase